MRATIKHLEYVDTFESEQPGPFGKPVQRTHFCRCLRLVVDVESEHGRIDDHFVYVPPLGVISREQIYGHGAGDHAASLESVVREVVFGWHGLEPAGDEYHHRLGGVDERIAVVWHPRFDHALLECHHELIESCRPVAREEVPLPPLERGGDNAAK